MSQRRSSNNKYIYKICICIGSKMWIDNVAFLTRKLFNSDIAPFLLICASHFCRDITNQSTL